MIGVGYIFPVTGATAPLAAQSRPHQQVEANITGDGAATSVVLTHNWGLSADENSAGWPEVSFEPLLPSFYTEKPQVTAKDANTVTITVVGTAADEFALVRMKRPHSGQR
jgi:hypothetical protein